MKLKVFGALALACVAVGGAGVQSATATSNDAAAPYILKPGVSAHYSGNVAFFSASVFCGQWKAIAQLQVGTQGVPVLHKTKYLCERATRTTVTFTIASSQLPVTGRYQYTLKVGRHDADGNVTRWTHSLSGFFMKY